MKLNGHQHMLIPLLNYAINFLQMELRKSVGFLYHAVFTKLLLFREILLRVHTDILIQKLVTLIAWTENFLKMV